MSFSSSSSSSSDSDDSEEQSKSLGGKRKIHGSVSSTKSSSSIRVKVAPNNSEYDPVVVSFPRGVPSSIAEADNPNTPPFFTYSKFKDSSSRGRCINGEDDHCIYSASAAGRGHDGRLSKTYVCIFDKQKNTLKLIPSAEKGTVFALDQTVKEYKPAVANDNLTTFGGGEETVFSAADRVQLLVDSFGSKKKQKVMESRAANKVNVHSVVGGGNFVPENVKGSSNKVVSCLFDVTDSLNPHQVQQIYILNLIHHLEN